MFCILYIFSHLSLCILLQQGFSLLGQKCQIRKVLVKIWSSCISALMEIHFVWIEKIWFHLPVISNKENWSDWANMKQVHAKAQSRKFEKRNKKVFSLCLDLVNYQFQQELFQDGISKIFPWYFGVLDVQQYSVSQWLSCEHWQVLVVTRGWDRAPWWIPMCLPSVLSCEHAKSNDQPGAERSTTNFWPPQHHQQNHICCLKIDAPMSKDYVPMSKRWCSNV